MTGMIEVNAELTITDSAMIWKMFRGQPVSNLINWMQRLSEDVRIFVLDVGDKPIPIVSKSEMRRFAHHAKKT